MSADQSGWRQRALLFSEHIATTDLVLRFIAEHVRSDVRERFTDIFNAGVGPQ